MPVVLLAVLVASAACGQEQDSKDGIGVIVTVPPQADFVAQVGGERVSVTVMVPPGASPHTYEPTPGQMTRVSEADMYAKVGSGVEFELAWMDRIIEQNRDMVIVDCSEGVELIEMASAHEEEEGHSHGAMDPHIWMSPRNAMTMVDNICDGLVEVDPGGQAYYEQRRDAYIEELAGLDSEIRDRLSGAANRAFMVFHPELGYFAGEYDLVMLAIEEEGKEPGAAGIARLIELAETNGIDVVFASPRMSSQSAEVIAREIGGEVVLFDSLGEGYISNMLELAAELARAME
jgi:zinc transport system substrate-binding protein